MNCSVVPQVYDDSRRPEETERHDEEQKEEEEVDEIVVAEFESVCLHHLLHLARLLEDEEEEVDGELEMRERYGGRKERDIYMEGERRE